MNAAMFRISLLAALAAAGVLLALTAMNTNPALAQEETDDPRVPIDGSACIELGNDLSDDQLTQLATIVRPRANLSRYHGANFIEWELVHSRYVLRNATGIYIPGQEWTTDHPQFVDVFPGDEDDGVNAPTHFIVQRSTDGGAWTDVDTVNNDPNRFVGTGVLEHRFGEPLLDEDGNEIIVDEAWKLDVGRFGGRQLSYYDNDILWPLRYPGATYHYRVVVFYNETCQVAVDVAYPNDRDGNALDGILVQDSIPTQCNNPANANYTEAGVRALLKPVGGDLENGYVLGWTNIQHDIVNQPDASLLEQNQRHHPNSVYHFTNEAHAAVAPIPNTLPHYAIQRWVQVGTTNNYYWKTVSNWANDGYGRPSEWVDDSAAPGGQYRLVAVYGPDCGVTLDPDPIAPSTCGDSANPEYKAIFIYRAMKPRRSLDEQRGVIITWKGIKQSVPDPDSAISDIPSRLVLQRSSVPEDTQIGVGDEDKAPWVTLAVHANDPRGGNMKYVDKNALPGSTHHYRLVAVYEGNCGVAPRNLKPVEVEVNLDLIESVSANVNSHPVVTFRQVYWASEYQLRRRGSNDVIPTDTITLSHEEGKATVQYTDTALTRERNAQSGARGDVSYSIWVVARDGKRYFDTDPQSSIVRSIRGFWTENE